MADKPQLIVTNEAKHTQRDNWDVMKPFVSFAFRAIKLIGLTLLAIVRALPTLVLYKNRNAEIRRK